MTGRGIDQILPHPSEPTLFEPSVRDARDYVMLAEERSGAIPRPVRFDYIWGDALKELERVRPDARIVNLETAVTRSSEALLHKDIHYRMHPNNVPCLTVAGIDVCVLANNHVLDWGERGLVETCEVLSAARLRVAGAGENDEWAMAPAIVQTAAGGRVLVFGVAHGSSGVPWSWAATPTHPGVWLLPNLSDDTAAAIGERIRRFKRPGDVAVVSIHWGSNWGYAVPDQHVRFAHALVRAGADVIHGHSSHHARPIETYAGRLILYGCGDFLNDYEGITGYEEYRADLAVMYFAEIDPRMGSLLSLRLVPMRTRRMRLERAGAEDVAWLGDVLARISRPYGAVVVPAPGGTLALGGARP